MHVPGSQQSSRSQPMRPVIPPIRTNYMAPTTLPGFYVSSDADISASDIPADGSISFFPYKDLSRIVIKQWDGNILESAVYALQPISDQSVQQQNSPPLPPPPPPVKQQSAQTQQQKQITDPAIEALLEGFKQMNAGLAGAMGQLTNSMQSIQENLERLNSRFVDEGGMG